MRYIQILSKPEKKFNFTLNFDIKIKKRIVFDIMKNKGLTVRKYKIFLTSC
jgi:hypothetical protein